MSNYLRFVAVLVFLFASSWSAAQPVALIPQPVSTHWRDGHFTINANTVIVTADSLRPSVEFFNDYLKKLYGLHLTVVDQSHQPATNYILLSGHLHEDPISTPTPTGDKYLLVAGSDRIIIEGINAPSVFYGIQTLIQLLPLSPFVATPTGYAIRSVTPTLGNPSLPAGFAIPAVSIEDYPRFAYRGLHLDAGRHFFPVDFVKKYIDYIALHKMNYFHWHLTEDQGWRIEIKKYPLLTEIGSCRSGTIIGHAPRTGDDSIRYCGYYTQEPRSKEVVKYAADRYHH